MNKKLNKNALMATNILLMMSVFTGCRLTVKEQPKATVEQNVTENEMDIITENKDICVGMFYTMEDMFMEADWNLTEEDWKAILNDEEVEIIKKKVESDRIYAVEKERVREDGSKYMDYAFENCEGVIAYKYNLANLDIGQVESEFYVEDGYNSDLKWNITEKDGERTCKIEGNIYVNSKIVDRIEKNDDYPYIFGYHVYQDTEGRIYIEKGKHSNAYAQSHKTSASEKLTINNYGENTVYVCEASVNIKANLPAEKTLIKQMNAEHKVIETISVDNSQVPDVVELNENASYIIVEEYVDNDMVYRFMSDKNYGISQYDKENDNIIKLPVNSKGHFFVRVKDVKLIWK